MLLFACLLSVGPTAAAVPAAAPLTRCMPLLVHHKPPAAGQHRLSVVGSSPCSRYHSVASCAGKGLKLVGKAPSFKAHMEVRAFYIVILPVVHAVQAVAKSDEDVVSGADDAHVRQMRYSKRMLEHMCPASLPCSCRLRVLGGNWSAVCCSNAWATWKHRSRCESASSTLPH